MAQQKTLFISDLHLDENHPEITDRFLKLLNDCDSTIDSIYILGDLFEAWIGDDDQTPFHQEMIQALKSATAKGLPIYFLHGNRDFLIGKRFLKDTGCKLLPDETKIFVYQTPVLLMHGDTLCTKDIAYLKARKILRNTFLQKLFLLLPLKLRRYFADKMRSKSKNYTESAPSEVMDVTHTEVTRVMQKHQVLHLIHGHTHRPNIHELSINNQPAQRIVLAAWHGKGSVLVWDDGNNKQFVDL